MLKQPGFHGVTGIRLNKQLIIQKSNKNNEVVKYKVSLVTQGFTQRLGFDFNETYSPVMNGITFRYLIFLAI